MERRRALVCSLRQDNYIQGALSNSNATISWFCQLKMWRCRCSRKTNYWLLSVPHAHPDSHIAKFHTSSTPLKLSFHEARCWLTRRSRPSARRAPRELHICNGGRRKVDRKGTSAGLLSYLCSRTLHPQAVLLGQFGPPFTFPHGELRATHRQTDKLTDWRARHKKGAWNLKGTSSPFGKRTI